MDSVFKELQQKLLNVDIKTVAKALGYGKVLSVQNRIETVKTSQSFSEWMYKDSGYDLKYTRVEFIKELMTFLEIDSMLLEPELTAYNEYEDKLRNEFQSYLFIDTGFRRKYESIMALAVLSSQRYIYVERTQTMVQNFSTKLAHVKKLIKEHMRKTDGDLGIWGKIKSYVWHYDEHHSISFLPDGSVEVFNASVDEPQATLTI